MASSKKRRTGAKKPAVRARTPARAAQKLAKKPATSKRPASVVARSVATVANAANAATGDEGATTNLVFANVDDDFDSIQATEPRVSSLLATTSVHHVGDVVVIASPDEPDELDEPLTSDEPPSPTLGVVESAHGAGGPSVRLLSSGRLLHDVDAARMSAVVYRGRAGDQCDVYQGVLEGQQPVYWDGSRLAPAGASGCGGATAAGPADQDTWITANANTPAHELDIKTLRFLAALSGDPTRNDKTGRLLTAAQLRDMHQRRRLEALESHLLMPTVIVDAIPDCASKDAACKSSWLKSKHACSLRSKACADMRDAARALDGPMRRLRADLRCLERPSDPRRRETAAAAAAAASSSNELCRSKDAVQADLDALQRGELTIMDRLVAFPKTYKALVQRLESLGFDFYSRK